MSFTGAACDQEYSNAEPEKGSRLLPVAGLLFTSGMCGLIFQVCWFREFRLLYGASTVASSVVLAAFMGGLGLGNAVLGARADRARNPLALYSFLEIVIALTAALSPLLIDALHRFYISLGGQAALGVAGATAIRLALSTLVLGMPTFLMGGTLPAAVRAVTARQDRQRRGAAVLYGANTFGAVVGALCTTFFALELFGTRTTLWFACLLNAVLALCAFRLSQKPLLSRVRVPPQNVAGSNDAEITRPDLVAKVADYVIYAIAAVAGFSFFFMELVWYRMLAPILGGSTFTFGLILAVALTGIGTGGAAYALFFRRRQVSLDHLAVVCALEACSIAIPFALGDRIAILAAQLRSANTWHFAGEVAGWVIIASIVVLPAAFFSGVQFPLCIAMLGHADRQIGKQVGLTFGWNTLGAICGSLAGGCGLLPLFSAPRLWQAVALLLTVVGLLSLAVARRHAKRPVSAFATLLTAFATLVMLMEPGPTAVWRHGGIGAGRGVSKQDLADTNSRQNWQNSVRRSVVWEADGVESSVAITNNDALSFVVNGKSDGNALGDAGTQIMLGLIGAANHANPQSAFVVGLGTGETAGWLAEVQSMQQVDVVELEPVVQEMARRCRDVNYDVLAHPKVHLIFNDAREALLTTAQHYDLIVCEPSNPYRSGVANLFTREFYRTGLERLNQGGIFVQWIQGYEIDDRTVRTVLATIQSVFSYIEIWEGAPGDLLLVGYNRQPTHSALKLRRKLAGEPFASALIRAWHTTDLEGFFSHYVGGPALVENYIRNGPCAINTDDRNEIEYGCARAVGRSSLFACGALHRQSAELADEKVPVGNGGVDWPAVEIERQWFLTVGYHSLPTEAEAAAQSGPHQMVLERFIMHDDAGMLWAWQFLPKHTACLTELAVIGGAYAASGNSRAVPLIERLHEVCPTEADALEAILAWNQNEPQHACRSLLATLRQLREDAWLLPTVREKALKSAVEFASVGPRDDLLAAVAKPFLVYSADELRREQACYIAEGKSPAATARFVETYEPFVPWTKQFLTLRKEVYTRSRHYLAGKADRDLQAFLRNETSHTGTEPAR